MDTQLDDYVTSQQPDGTNKVISNDNDHDIDDDDDSKTKIQLKQKSKLR